MANLAIRSFTTIGYVGAALIITFVVVLTLASTGDDGNDSIAVAPATATPEPTATAEGPRTVTVGVGGDFATLEGGVNAAEPGGIVEVRAGVYEELVYINEPVTIRPAGDGDVWIDRGCQEAPGIHIYSGSGVTISGIGIRNVDGAGVVIGITGDDAEPPDHVTLDGLTIENFNCEDDELQNHAGIAVWYGGCCHTITDNTITYRTSGEPRGYGNGIWFKSTDEEPSGGGHTISGNVISGGWDGIGGEAEADDHGSFDRDSVIENNTVTDCWDDGIQVEGGNQNIVVAENFVSGCGTGIAFAPTIYGPLYVERNVIRDLVTGLYENLFCFKVGYEEPGEVYLTDNDCVTEGDGIMNTNTGLPTIISRGNCFIVSRYIIQMAHTIPPGTDLDGDYMWTDDDETFIEWRDSKYYDLEEFQQATGQEANAQMSEECPDRPPFTES